MKLDLRGFVLFLAVLQPTCLGLEVTVPGSSQNASLGTHVRIPCTFTVKDSPVNPNFLAVVWKFGERELVKFDNKGISSNSKASIDVKAAMNGDVSLSLRDVATSDEGTYKCIVIYSPEMDQKTIDLRVRASPSVYLTRKAFQKGQKNTVLCSVTDFYPEAISLTWLWNGQVVRTSNMGKPRRNADGTYNVNSTLVITPTNSQENQIIECQVEHESLGKPTKDVYKVIFGEAPTIEVHSLEIPGRREKIVMCEAKSFSPEVITVNWKLNGQQAETSGRNADGTFNKRIYYLVQPSPDNKAEDISCEVRHETLFSPVTETKSVTYFSDKDKSCRLGLAVMLGVGIAASGIGVLLWIFICKKKYFQHFNMSPIYELENDDDKVTFYCAASNCPKEIQVVWRVKDAGGETTLQSDHRIEDDKERLILSGYRTRTRTSEDDGQHQVITALYFTPSVSKHRNTRIVCRFICDGKTKEKVKKWSFTLPKPQVSDENPIALSLGDSKDVLCSINLKKFSPKDIHIAWSCGVGHYQDLDTFKTNIRVNSQQTFDAESECRILKHLFNEPGFKVRVTWTHKSMDQPEWREVSAAAIPWRPTVLDISVPRLLHSKEAKLQCTISGYFPDELTVNWLRREAGQPDLFPVSSSEKYKIPENEVTQREDDKTYTCTASLIVNVSWKTEHGAKFMCRVGHPSLDKPLEKETEKLEVIGFPTVDVHLETIKSDHPFVASVTGFCPKPIEVKWSRKKKKGQYEEYQETDVANEFKEKNDGTFDLISKCKIERISHEKQYKVSVKHDTLESPIEKILSFSKDPKGYFIVNEKGENISELSPWREDNPPAPPAESEASGESKKWFPTVDVYRNPRKSDHPFVASVTGFCPKPIEVKWSRKKKKGQYEEYQESNVANEFKEKSDGTFDLISKCKIQTIKHEKQYKVSVKHDPQESPIEKILAISKDPKGYFIVNEKGENISEIPPWREDNPPAPPTESEASGESKK